MGNPNAAEAGWSLQRCFFDPDKGAGNSDQGSWPGARLLRPVDFSEWRTAWQMIFKEQESQ